MYDRNYSRFNAQISADLGTVDDGRENIPETPKMSVVEPRSRTPTGRHRSASYTVGGKFYVISSACAGVSANEVTRLVGPTVQRRIHVVGYFQQYILHSDRRKKQPPAFDSGETPDEPRIETNDI